MPKTSLKIKRNSEWYKRRNKEIVSVLGLINTVKAGTRTENTESPTTFIEAHDSSNSLPLKKLSAIRDSHSLSESSSDDELCGSLQPPVTQLFNTGNNECQNIPVSYETVDVINTSFI